MQTVVADEISSINEQIAQRIGQQKFRVWFHNSTRFTLADGYLKVGVPNLFIGGWIEKHYIDEISEAVAAVTGTQKKIAFNIEPDLLENQRRGQMNSQARSVNREKNKNVRSRISPKAAVHKKPKLTLDNFVVGTSNQLAYNAAKTFIDEELSPFNPLFIHGGYGLGKTHLLQGICNAICNARPTTNSLYVSAEQFTNEYVLALKTKKLDAFRRRFRQTDLLAIDDIHFLASKPSTQEEFLHTFNTIDLAGKKIILASDAHPKMIGQLCERLVSRFVSGMVVKIDQPDLQTRSQICRLRAAAMKKNIPEPVIQYIAENMRTNVRELEGALIKLVAFASLSSEKITVAMAQQVLAEHISRTDPIVHICDIESAVATYFGITPADIHSSKKDRTVSLARSFSMHLARNYTRMSYPEIGRLMGNKNHATVILANRKIQDLIKNNSTVNWKGPNGNKVAYARDIADKLKQSIS